MAKISLETLTDLVLEEGISEAELQILALALEGKSPTEIKTILGSSSENAVQKKLARIYAKFRIAGAGPGKLAKLQKILLERLQAKQGKKRVLLCFAGEYQPQQVEGIGGIFKHPQIEIATVNVTVSPDSTWLAQLGKSLKNSSSCLVCLDQSFLESTHGNFVIGFLSGRTKHLKLLCFSPVLLHTSSLPVSLLDGTRKEILAQLLGEMIGNVQEAEEWVDFKLSTSNWLDTLQQMPALPVDRQNDRGYQLVVDAGQQLVQTNPCFQANHIFRELLTESLTTIGLQLEAVGAKGQVFSIPLELYPRYLVALQRRFRPVVKAVAVIQSVERFWGADAGDEIGESANPISERLFVFSDEASFNKSASFLLKHALHYKVYVTTWETYKPLAAEYSVQDTLTEWKDKDYSLPTREYAIIKTPDQGQLPAWYAQDTIASHRTARFVNFSAVPEQATLYEAAFDRLVRAQGVFQFRSSHFASQDGVIEELDQLKHGLFHQAPPINLQITSEQLLENLQKFRNELIHKDQNLQKFRNELIYTEQTPLENRKNAVIQTALQRVREILHAQIVSIFLFAKNGRLHRVGIEGIDHQGQPIDHQTFYEGESYAVGESFTGRAAVPVEDGYGKPQWTNQLDEEDLGEKTKAEYSRKFKLHCAIAVPLNGQNKTYGVLQVINKVDFRTGNLLDYCSFAPNEIPLLSAIGSFVATAISNFRRDRQNKLYADLSNLLIRSPSAATELQETYERIVQGLISDETAFEVCILRVKTRGALVVQARAAIDRVRLETREDKPIQSGDGLVGRALQSGQPTIVEHISQRIDQFKSKDWIQLNGFESFGCFPLIYKDEVVGTLSLYTGYKYEFHPGVQEFLGRVSFLIAAFIGKMIESAVVRDVINQLDELDETEQAIDSVALAKARRELNDTFIRSAGSEVDPPDSVPHSSSGDLIYLD